MLENLRLRKATERSIVLQTRRGREIKNVIDVEPEHYHVQKYQLLLRKHPRWKERKPPAGGYNCVGHVWASRRTGVFDDLEDQLSVIFDDALGFLLPPAALRTALQRSRAVGEITTALRRGEISEEMVRIFVNSLASEYQEGKRLPGDLALAALAVALEHIPTDYAEEFL